MSEEYRNEQICAKCGKTYGDHAYHGSCLLDSDRNSMFTPKLEDTIDGSCKIEIIRQVQYYFDKDVDLTSLHIMDIIEVVALFIIYL